jgi:S1-C subfamily serine protease
VFWSATAVALALASVWVTVNYALGPASRSMTPEEVGATVLEILKTTSLPSPAARAYAAIKPSVVRVSALRVANATGDVPDTSIGTGVVIIDRGVILTSLHVVAAAERVSVVFDDGTESDATVVVRQPERDIAVLTVSNLPDNLVAATLRSTQGLTPGERVVAVGFPFGIGPSVSAGVISGLGRQHRSKTGEHMIENLIQFDAAVNPGSSGGPLVTADGEVIGIVSSIINPNNSNVFAGVAFAVPIENAASVAGTSPF